MQRSLFLHMCDLKKKNKKKRIYFWGNQQTGNPTEARNPKPFRGKVGTSRGRGRGRGWVARARSNALQAPIYSTAAILNLFFSRPPLSGAPRRLLVVDAATQLLLLALSPLLALTSLTPLPSLYAFVLWFAIGARNLLPFLCAQGSGPSRSCFRQVSHFLRCLVLSSLKSIFAFYLQTTAMGLGLIPFMCLRSL